MLNRSNVDNAVVPKQDMLEPDSPPGKPRQGFFRAVARALLRLCVGLALLPILILLLLQVPPIARWTANTTLRLANPWEGSSTSIGGVGGSWLRSLALYDVRIQNADSTLLMSLDTLEAEYDLTGLFVNELRVGTLKLRNPMVLTGVTHDGTWLLLKPFEGVPEEQEAPVDTSGGFAVIGERVSLAGGTFAVRHSDSSSGVHLSAQELDLSARAIRIGGSNSCILDSLKAQCQVGDSPDDTVSVRIAGSILGNLIRADIVTLRSPHSDVTAHGTIALPFALLRSIPATEFSLTAKPLSYRDLHPFVPTLRPDGKAFIDFKAEREANDVRAFLQCAFPGGGSATVTMTGQVFEDGNLTCDVTGEARALSIAALTGAPDTTEHLNATFRSHGTATSLEDITGSLIAEARDSRLVGLTIPHMTLSSTTRNGAIDATATGIVERVGVFLRGQVSPFTDNPPYRLNASFTIPRQDPHSGPRLVDRLQGMRCVLNASGSGFDPRSAEGNIALAADWEGNRHLKSLVVKGGLAGSAVRVSGDLTTVGGTAQVNASARFGDEVSFDLQLLQFRNLNLATFLGEGASSSFTGLVSARGRGTEIPTMSADLLLEIHASRFRHFTIDTLRTRASLDGGALNLAVAAETNAGAMALEAYAEPFSQKPRAEIRRLDFRHLDLGIITESGGISTDLNGSMDAGGNADSPATFGRLIDGLPLNTQSSVIASVHLLLSASRLNRQDLSSGILDARFFGGELSMNFDLRTPRGGMTVIGKSRPFDRVPTFTVPEARFHHIDLGPMTGTTEFTTDLTGVLSADVQGTSPTDGVGAAALTLHQSMINNEPLSRASIRGTKDRTTTALTADATLENGTINVNGEGTYLDGTLTGKTLGSIRMHDLSRLLGDTGIVSSTIVVDLSAEGTWGRPEHTRLTGLLSAQGRLDTVRVDSLLCRLSVLGRTVDVDTLMVSSNVVTVNGAGALAVWDTTGTTRSDFTADASLLSLEPLNRLANLTVYPSGKGRFSCSISGTALNTEMNLTATVRDARVEDMSVTRLDASASGQMGPGLSVRQLDATAEMDQFLSGNLEIERTAVTLSSDGQRHTFRSAVQLDSTTGVLALGQIAQDADGTTVTLDTLAMSAEGRTWNLERQASVSFGKRLRVSGFHLLSTPGEIAIDGVVDPDGDQDFSVRVDSFAFARAARLLGRGELGGLLSLDLHLTGPARAVQAVGSVQTEVFAGKRPLGTLHAGLDWNDSLLTIQSMITQPDSARLDATVKLPATFSLAREDSSVAGPRDSRGAPLELSFHTERFNLDMIGPFLDPAALGRVGGILTADITLTRSMDSLWGSGSLSVDSGVVFLPALGVEYGDITLRSSLDASLLKITGMSMRSGDGTLAGEGGINLRSVQNPVLDLSFTASDFRVVQNADVKATLSGTVNITGTTSAPSVSGRVILRESYYIIAETSGPGQVESVELTDRDYTMLEERLGYRRRPPQRKESSSPLALSIDLAVEMERNTWIRKRSNPTLAVELEGKIAVRSLPGQPFSIVGLLRPMTGRSYAGQFGRQFDITGGEIRFNGPPEDVDLDINSEYKVPSKSGGGMAEVVLRMRMERHLNRFSFSLTSDPPMDESDILSYLATGTASTGALASTQSQGSLGASAALEQVVGAVGGLTEGTIPLDIFQIRQDGARGVTIVAGNYVTPKTYVGVRQPILLNNADQNNYYSVGTEFEVEYEGASWLFLNAKGGAGRLMLFLKSRYAY